MNKFLSFVVTLAIALLVTAITMCVVSGCAPNQQPDQQKAIKAIAGIALAHGELQHKKALDACPDPNDCPKAQRIQKWLDTGNRFLAYLDNPIPESQYDAILLGLDVLLMEMEQQGADAESVLYVEEIRILFIAFGGSDAT